VPLDVLCEKLVHTRFEPMGMTINKEIPMVKSLMDYLGRWLALKFMTKTEAKRFHNGELIDKAYATGSKSKDAFAMRLPVVDEGTSAATDMGSAVKEHLHEAVVEDEAGADTLEGKIENAKLQGYTGSICTECGSTKMKRNGSCELCLDCGGTSGCS